MPSPLFEALGIDQSPVQIPVEPKDEGPGFVGRTADAGISLLKGAIAVPEAAVGLTDLVTGGHIGKALEEAGYRPAAARGILDEWYSPQQKEAFRRVQEADGFVDTLGEAVKNPSVIAQSVLESAPSILAGGVVGRGAIAVAPKLSPVVAGAIGEGATQAGQAAEQIRQESPDKLLSGKQAALAAASGAIDTGIAVLGGKIAQRFGLADIDTMLAGAQKQPKFARSVVREMLEGAATEGVLEELPQSIQEQVLQNIAQDKPIDEGVDQAAVLGMLSGMAMGGGANVVSRGAPEPVAAPAPAVQTPAEPASVAAVQPAPVEPAGPLSRAAAAAQPHTDPAALIAGTTEQDPVQTALRQKTEEDITAQNLANWFARAEPMPLDKAQSMKARAAEELGRSMEVVPHGDGFGFTVVPSEWVAPTLRNQVAQGEKEGLLPLDTNPTGVLRADAQGNVTPETHDQAMASLQVAAQIAAAQQRKADLGLTPDIEAIQAGVKRQPPDITLANGEPFKNRGAAVRAQRKAGRGTVTPVDGGWIVSMASPSAETIDVPAREIRALPHDTTPTGVLRADAEGTITAETAADRINTKQARAEQDAERARKAELGLTPDVEAAQAGVRRTAKPLPDITQKNGQPFKNKGAATRAQKAAGRGAVVEVPGGWIVRQQEVSNVSAGDGAGAVVAEPGRQLGDQPAGSRADTAAARSDGAGRVGDTAAAPAVGGQPSEPVRNGTGEQPAGVAKEGTSHDPSDVVRELARTRPFEHFADVYDLAEKTVGADGVKELKTRGNFMNDAVTEAVRAGQYEGVREWAKKLPVPILEGQINRETARRAHAGTSHSPEARGAAEIRNYVNALSHLWRGIQDKYDAADEATKKRVREQFTALRDGYASRVNAYLSAHAQVASPMIAGPAKFPVNSNRKKSDTASRRAQEAGEFLVKGKQRIARAFAGPVDNSLTSALADVEQRIKDKDALQERMKAANAALRKGDDAALRALGFDDERIAQLKKPDFAGRTGFPDFALRNNNAEIRRLKERQADIQARIASAEEAGQAEEPPEAGGPRIEQDAQANRVRIHFEGKPDEATRTALKKAGFRWSPTNGAWQRQLTQAAVAEARRIISQQADEMPQFRRTNGTPVGQDMDARKAALQQFVNAIAKNWKNAPQIIVARDMQDPAVPEKVRETNAAQRSQGADDVVHGFHYQGKVYLIAEGISSPRDAIETLAHEALGHYGLQGFFGEALKPIKQQIVAMRKKEVLAKAAAYGMPVTPEAVREELGPGATAADVKKVIDLRLQYAAEEVLAEMAQTTPQLGFVRRAVAAIRTWLRENVPGFKDLHLTDDEIIRSYILPARGWVVRGEGTGARRAGGEVNFSKAPATDSAAFKKWFAGSKVVDDKGRPLVVYHGTASDISEFKVSGRNIRNGKQVPGIYASPLPATASAYARTAANDKNAATEIEDANVMPLYMRITNPAEFTDPGEFAKADRAKLEAAGHDGAFRRNQQGEVVEVVAFSPEQIKSATGNRGTFDPNNADIMFSRGAAGNVLPTEKPLRQQIMQAMNDTFNAPGKLNWWHRSVGTMYNLAQRSPEFKRVFDSVQDFIHDVSLYATEAADLAPRILPKLETLRDIGKSPISAADNKAISAPIFEGTLLWTRGPDGKPMKAEDLRKESVALGAEEQARRMLRAGKISESVLKMWQGRPVAEYEQAVNTRYENQMLQPGIVWKDSELREMFHLNDEQIGLYKEFREAVDKSLSNLAVSDMIRFAGEDITPQVRQQALDAGDPIMASMILRDHILEAAKNDPARNDLLVDTANRIVDKGDRVRDLIERGYAPLSRFGHYTLDVVGKDGERLYFGMFESPREAARMARKMAENFFEATITRGTVSQEEYKLFAGVSPETVELFGEMLGLEATGDDAKDKAFQTYIKVAKANRSAMKRLIERKGIAGFSEEAGRVLAGFVYSNARQTSQNLHMGEMTQAAADVSKGEGELKDQATRLVDYVKNPQEEAQGLRGLLFAQYLGGSVASAMVNMLQPAQVTFPYLSQFGGATKAAAQMTRAFSDAAKRKTGDATLDAALKKAEEEGIVAPQEVHQLMAQAQGRGVLKSGDGTTAGDARAKASNALSRLTLAWGKLFGAAEQFNRRVTFIAAYRTAVAQGIADPAKFAEKAIAETQFIYTKGNKPEWARGAIGSTIFTFKQYSISYVELLHRMATQNGPEGKKAALLALGMLFLLSGAGGLPFAEDAEDVVDGVMQRLGYNFSSKVAKREFFARILGKDLGRFAEHGLSGLPGAPIDVAGRLGLGNLIPGTGLLTKKQDHTRDVTEFVGAAGDLATRTFKAANLAVQGDLFEAGEQLAPRAASNAAKAYEMYTTGLYKDANGKKVIDVDGFDAMSKLLGFQPTGVSREQERLGLVQNMKAQNQLMEQQIADKWARAVAEGDQAGLAAAREQLKDWNEKNPDTRIFINRSQINRRVKELRMSKEERVLKSTPKELRATVRRELEPA